MSDFTDNIRRGLIATKRLARACHEAQWDESFDALRPGTIEHALALQIGAAALREMQAMSREFEETGTITLPPPQRPCTTPEKKEADHG